jgi:hypothetical protein
MSLALDIDKVKAVLLRDGQWYSIKWNAAKRRYSFDLDAYEIGEFWVNTGERKSHMLLPGGIEQQAGIPATGFEFVADDGRVIAGPLTSILAMEMDYKITTGK